MKHTVVELRYQDDNGNVMGYSLGYIDMKHLKERFSHYNIRRDNIINMFIDKQPVSKTRLDNLFHVLEHTSLPKREEEESMKNGKKPNRAHKEIIAAANLTVEKWLVVKNLPHKIEIVHKETGELKELAV
ncbi:DUF6906 family protein [Priestia aryabhattai]|uniref:DUF6906 domain-containing protein n=1 Tax=Priestia aryabhattai TaxID=412384 RepID=A0ABD7X407_PRIAR|nr:hypothetical protein [Priestia aryabhattai]WEA47316.1 hypothetical protein PWO00_28485 [Priestia aryabhattai]